MVDVLLPFVRKDDERWKVKCPTGSNVLDTCLWALANAISTEHDGVVAACAHVVEPLSLAYGGDVPMDLTTVQDQLHDTAKIQLTRLAATLDVPSERCHLVFGRPETEIQLLAEQIGADLIVVGSHGRHGLALLLGSTSTGVLHGSPCDVLAVRVGDVS